MSGARKLYRKTTENLRLLTGPGWKVNIEDPNHVEEVKVNGMNQYELKISRKEEQPLDPRKQDESIGESHKFSEVVEDILKPESPRLPTNNNENAVDADFVGNLKDLDDFLDNN